MQGKLANIQVLRAVAAVAVVLFHAAMQSGAFVPIAAAGVDIFFVISGFIMWSVTQGGARPWRFLRDRVARIVPLYWAATLLVALAGMLKLSSLAIHSDELIKSLLFIPYRSFGHLWPLLVPGWTLNYEMFFYLLFGVILFVRNRVFQLCALGVVLIGLAGTGLLLRPTETFALFYTDNIIAEFFLGAALADLALRWRPSAVWPGVLAVGLGCLGFALAACRPDLGPRVLAWGAPALLLVAGAVWLEQAGAAAWAPLVFLGDASYSIYLSHPFSTAALKRVLHVDPWPLNAALLVIGAMAVGAAVHWGVERPLQRLLRRRKARPDDAKVTAEIKGSPS